MCSYHEDFLVENEKNRIMSGIRTIKEQDDLLKKIWNELEDIPFVEDERGELFLDKQWKIFPAGTSREEIWHWFDERYSEGVVALLYPQQKNAVNENEKLCDLCEECMSEDCIYNPHGICKLPLVKGRPALITENGCMDCVPPDIIPSIVIGFEDFSQLCNSLGVAVDYDPDKLTFSMIDENSSKNPTEILNDYFGFSANIHADNGTPISVWISAK